MIFIKDVSYQYQPNSKAFSYPYMQCTIDKPLLITGKSGCGKTTLLHLIAGLIPQFIGSISINNTHIENLTAKQLDAFRGNHIGIVFQQHYFIQSLNVVDNIAMASPFSRPSTNFIQQLSHRLYITELLYKKTYQLSVGEQQRVAIAKALVKKPTLLIADEPTSSLDATNAIAVIQLLQQQAIENNACLIVVTHDERIQPYFTNTIQLL